MLASLATSLVRPVISPVVKGIHGGEVTRAVKGYIDKKILVPLYPPSSIEINIYFNCQTRFNGDLMAYLIIYLEYINWSVCNKFRW